MFSNSAFFSDLTPIDVQLLSSHSTTKVYPKHCVLINEGDESDALYVILKGKVKIFVSDDNGREVTLNIQGTGEYFGELALLDEEPRSASVITLERSRIALIPKSEFQRCLLERPEISLKLMRAMARRIRALTNNVKNMALLDVYGRLVLILEHLAVQKDGKLVIEQRLTHQDIANMVGASREMISRIMKDLVAGGHIELKKKKIIICNKLPAAW
jgi:CRP/FNR family cyclic AMP-dependent transcriptional regulator